MRGLAVLLVFLFHYGGGLRSRQPLVHALGCLSQAGWVGVEVFFALSGYLITGLLLDSLGTPHLFRSFYLRRARRILPLYLLALVVCALGGVVGGSQLAQLRPLLVYGAFLQSTPPFQQLALSTPPPFPVYHLWSLAVEAQFYLLWPLLLLLARTPGRIFALCCSGFALSLFVRVAIAHAGTDSPHLVQAFAASLPVRAGGLAAGSALAALRRFKSGPPRLSPLPHISAVSAFGAFCLISLRAHSFLLGARVNFVFGLAFIDVGAAALLAMLLTPGVTRSLFTSSWLASLGRVSYSFYVWHVLLMPVFDRIGWTLTHTTSGFLYQAARLAAAFPLTVILSWLSFTYIEKPLLRPGLPPKRLRKPCTACNKS